MAGRICADVGASTGGFTDCLLQHGASKVYAIDVGEGILDWKLRQHPQVVVMEGTNARYVERLPEPVSLVTIDASFISLKVLLPVVKEWLPLAPVPLTSSATPTPPWGEGSRVRGDVIALIKPQFEAGRQEVRPRQGRDPRPGGAPPGAAGCAGLRGRSWLAGVRLDRLAAAGPQGQPRIPGMAAAR